MQQLINTIQNLDTSKKIYIMLFVFFILLLAISFYKKRSLINTQLSKEETYNEEFQDVKKAVITMYYVDWCGYCNKAKPEFKALQKYSGQILHDNLLEVRSVNCDTNKEEAEKENVTSYPTIKLKTHDNTYIYDGKRTKKGILEYLKNILN